MNELGLYYIKGKTFRATATYDSTKGHMLLHKGSVLSPTVSATYLKSKLRARKRESLINEFTTIVEEQIVLIEDIEFDTPSEAASFCIGSNVNGWSVWMDQYGVTLDCNARK